MRRFKNKKGFALVTSYLVIVMLLILLVAFVSYSFTEAKAARKYQMTTTALYLAEAGIDHAILLIKEMCYAGGSCSQQFSQFMTLPVGATVRQVPFMRFSELGGFEWTTTVENKIPNQNYPGWEEVICKIRSTGHTPTNDPASPNYHKKEIEAFVKVRGSLFPAALHTKSEIDLNNATVDSYDSSKGPYGANNRSSNGNVYSNNVNELDNVIVLRGGTTVYGDVRVSVPHFRQITEYIDIKGNSSITGDTDHFRADRGIKLNSVTIPGGAAQIDLSNVNKTQIYPGGTYTASSIKVDGQGSLQFQGPTTIYVDGDVDIGGNGIVTADNFPPNLIIKVKGNRKIDIHGNGNFYGALYAPDSKNIKVMGRGNAEVFGSVVGYSATVNGNIHYDEALSKIPGNYMNVNLIAWQDLP